MLAQWVAFFCSGIDIFMRRLRLCRLRSELERLEHDGFHVEDVVDPFRPEFHRRTVWKLIPFEDIRHLWKKKLKLLICGLNNHVHGLISNNCHVFNYFSGLTSTGQFGYLFFVASTVKNTLTVT